MAKTVNPKDVARAKELVSAGLSRAVIAKKMGKSEATISRYVERDDASLGKDKSKIIILNIYL